MSEYKYVPPLKVHPEKPEKKTKKATRIVVRMSLADMTALKIGMSHVGEESVSGYIRRLIHDKKRELVK